MINKNEMRKAAHELNLKGARIEIYKLYNDNNINIKLSYEDCIKIDDDKESLSRVKSFNDMTYIVDYDSTDDILASFEFDTLIKDKEAATSEIDVKHYGCNLAIPYTNFSYFEEEKPVGKMIKYGNKSPKKIGCEIFSFDVNLHTVPVLKDNIEQITKYFYTTNIGIPSEDLNNGVYVHLIQCKDVSLPIIMINKNKMELEEIKDIVFKGNVKPDIYNSYFHPYKKEIIYCDDIVYGEPYNGCIDLEFEENIKDNSYITNDGLKAVKKDNNIIEVFLDDFKIGDYMGDDVNYIENISFVEYMKDIDIYSPHYRVCNYYSIQDLINIHPEISRATYFLPSFNEGAKPIEQIDPNDLIDTKYTEVYRLNCVMDDNGDDLYCVICVKDNIFQVYTCIAGEKDMYYINNRKNTLNIGITEDKENNRFIYSGTNNRFINYSRDGSLISFKPNYMIALDHSNTIINTNLPLDCDKFVEYNMFGIPVDF